MDGSERRRRVLLLVLSGNMLIDALEVSTVVVALPAIADGFGVGPAGAATVMVAFALGFGGALLPAGRLLTAAGRRRCYLWAMAIFAVASVLSGLAMTLPVLLATRVVKGVCVALTAPTGLAIIASTFPPGPARERAVSVYSLTGASGFSIGLVLSGLLTPVDWRWALVCSGPVALVLLLMARKVVPADPVALTTPARPPIREILASRSLWRACAGGAVLNGTFWGFLLVVTFHWRREHDWSPWTVALALLPTSVPLVVSAAYARRLLGRWGRGWLIAAGSLAALGAYAWYLVDATAVAPPVVLIGVAFALSFAALNAEAVAGSPPERQRLVGGVYQTAVQLGGAAMLALVALTGVGHRPALYVITAAGAAGLLAAVAALRADPRSRRDVHIGQDPIDPVRPKGAHRVH